MTDSYGTVAALTLVAVLMYLTWTWRERARGRRAAHVHESVAALGDDAVPASLHPKIDGNRCIGSGACVRACPEHDVIGLIGGRVHLVNPLACVGHGACMAACPVQAIELVFGTEKRGVELPMVGPPDFQTSQKGVYVVGELAGMGLIRNAVEQGRQAAAYIADSGRRGGPDVLDVLVVGGGPAGTSATLALRARGLDVLCVEQDAFGGTIQHYPRAKVVMTGTLDFEGYRKVKRRTMTKEQLVELWTTLREETKLPVETGVRVVALAPEGKTWRVEAENGRILRAASVVLALGRRGTPRKLGVEGEDLSKVHYRLIEPDPFRGKHVLVVGGGNAAAECVLALADDGQCASLALSYRRAELARLRSDVRARLEDQIERGRVEALLPSEVERITADTVTLKGGAVRPNDAIIVQIGGTPPTELLTSFGVQTVVKRGRA